MVCRCQTMPSQFQGEIQNCKSGVLEHGRAPLVRIRSKEYTPVTDDHFVTFKLEGNQPAIDKKTFFDRPLYYFHSNNSSKFTSRKRIRFNCLFVKICMNRIAEVFEFDDWRVSVSGHSSGSRRQW